ncbi:MAG: Crp/Fnr family transcriptional regulator [Deferribacteres bacterium]|nr:Crp/Fnr family transcriptional regulator [candidate division KSB1 bacterium]MCB9500422.1 Crp/Fnr family transcriptional regulator [Deferribacteres bacterium]
MNKQDFIKKLPFYHEAPDRLKSEINNTAIIAQLKNGDYYFHEGDSCANIAIVVEGRIRVFKTGESGRVITLYTVEEQETCILTTFCLLSDRTYPATAQAELNTQAVIFPAPVFRQWMNDWDIVRSFVFTTMTNRVSDMMALIEEITFKKLDRRLVEFLAEKSPQTNSVLQITHEQIAMQIGSAREVISRLLKEFERLGALELRRGQIILKDLTLLENAVK